MGWFLLALAIVVEVIGTVALKYSQGFTVLMPSAIVVVGYTLSFYLLAVALKRHVPLSSAYAVWSAVGTAAIALIGIVLFSEQMNTLKFVGLVAIIFGVVALSLGGAR